MTATPAGPETQGSSFRLRVLGVPGLVDHAGQTPPALGWGKPLAVLCYLAVRGEARREEIVDLLWRNVEEGRARNAFRQALHRLRTALGDELVPRDRDRLRLGQSERLAIDVVDFERHVRAGRLDQAVAVYAGDFLEGSELGEPPFDHWAEQERTRLRSRFRRVLQDAVLDATSGGHWAEAISRAKRLQNLAPFEPEAAMLAATTLLSAGRRGEALELLRRFAERTERELGVPVHADVQALIARLSREALATPTASRAAASGPGEITALPFVGREPELSQLLSLWQTVGEDAGALALIEGEAGIGKTRLVQELIANARSLGPALVVSGRERAAGAQLPYGVFGEALRPLVRAPGVAGASAHLLAEAARLLPEMRDSFDLPQVSAVEDEASRLRFFEGVAALVDAAAYEQRMLVVLEELQHTPPSSLDLLSYLATRLAGAPIMFVLTIRPADAAPVVLSRLRALAESSDVDGSHAHGLRARRLSLASLSTEHAITALRGATHAAGIPPANLERIARQAGGNPLRLVHTLRAAAAGEDLSASTVPLRDLLLERLQRLSSTQRRVFVVLALLGRPATLSLLSSAAHVSDASCRDGVRVLEQHALVERTELGVRVANDLAAEIALDVAGGAGRAFLSGWIAEAIARQPDAVPAELARLYAAAGNAPQAFANARRAAFDFLAEGAEAEAAQLFVLARTFAASSTEHAEVEGVLDALGSGRRRLPVAVESESPLRSGETRYWSHGPAPSRRQTPAPLLGRWERLFPNWRVLFGGALATLLVSAAVLGMRGEGSLSLSSRPLDTLVVSEGLANAPGSRRLAVGSLRTGFVLGARIDKAPSDPAWVDSLSRDWSNAVASPHGVRVAVSRLTPRGMDLYVISRDRRDSVVLLRDQRNATPLGWSPDGTWLLAVRNGAAAGGGFDAGLLAFRVIGQPLVVPIDTGLGHAVAEAMWSPDGSHVAWVARVGPERQLDVFASLADGSGVRNVSRDPGEDYHIAWSPDGELLAFTSTRDGNPELYAADLLENRLWRLTHDVAHDDRAAFSPDGRSLAFESTRGSTFGVYVMPALGGEARAVGGGAGTPMEIVGWRSRSTRFVDFVRVDSRDVTLGDSATLHLRAFDDFGDSIPARRVEWRVLDSTLARFAAAADSNSAARTIRGLRPGLGRVLGTVGRWRSDTAFVRVGSGRVPLIQEDFSGDLARWRALGSPAPVIAGQRPARSLLLRANREWGGGLLSRGSVPLTPGLTVNAAVTAPWGAARDVATETSVAIVAPEDDAVIDSVAPQFLRLASIAWKAEAGRFVYAVGKEVFTEPVSSSVPAVRRLAMFVEADSTVSFMVDDTPRWRSTLRVVAPRVGTRAQLWIGAHAAGDQVRVSSVSVLLAALDSVAWRRD